MSLLLRVKALAEAVGADIKSIKTDPRLADAREWSADTITQDEAEAGTASTRRAWTAQRVWQAINAWWQLVTSGFGRNFIAATNEQAARNVLQLGTAATKNVGELAGDVLPVGVSMLGQNPSLQTEFDLNADGMRHGLGLYFLGSGAGVIGSSYMSSSQAFVGTEYNYPNRKAYILFGDNMAASGSRLVARYELCHTGNLLQTTGSSTEFPMSQAATTSALSGKAALRAASNIDGGVRMRLSGTTLYITNDGSDA